MDLTLAELLCSDATPVGIEELGRDLEQIRERVTALGAVVGVVAARKASRRR